MGALVWFKLEDILAFENYLPLGYLVEGWPINT
jgi:hypothetical protein